jgi:two-component system sporulation sensor kinase A
MVDTQAGDNPQTVEELRRRLTEAEENLQAIRRGEVDAFVVNTPTGEQIYTLQGTDTIYRKILEEMAEGAIILGSDNIILYCNASFANVVSGNIEKVLGTNFFNYVSPKNFENFTQLLSESTQSNVGAAKEFRLISLNGKETPVHVSSRSIPIGDIKTRYLVVTDLSEREAAARKVLENERFLAIGKVTAMVAHDIRGPLNIVSQATEMLKMNPEMSPRMLPLIEDNTKRALDILSNLRENTKELELVKRESDVDELLRKTLNNMMIPSSILTRIDSPGPTSVVLDSVQMGRVFSNLINNAVEAMPDGGRLGIEIRSPPGRVEVEFSDTGMGIPDSVVDKIFEPFVSTKSKGTGLGLPLCKRVVDAHGGEISFKTEKGKGTSFTVSLPKTG